MSILGVLDKLGFGPKDSRVYLACLEMGSATATNISKRAGIARPTTYRVLESLVRRGLVEVDTKARIKTFVARNPVALVALFEQQSTLAKHHISDLMSVFSETNFKPKLKFYDGANGIKQAFEDALATPNSVIYTFSPIENVLLRFGKTYARHFTERRVAKNIGRQSLRQITNQPQAATDWEFYASDKSVLREVRFLPKQVAFSTLVQIYGNKVSVIASEKENFAFVIESPELVNFMKQVFTLLWSFAQPSPNILPRR